MIDPKKTAFAKNLCPSFQNARNMTLSAKYTTWPRPMSWTPKLKLSRRPWLARDPANPLTGSADAPRTPTVFPPGS